VAIDDACRIAFSSLHPDEGGCSACQALLQALCYLLQPGHPFPLRHLRTKPYTPPTNGKAERFIQISLHEWAYARSYESYGQRVQHPDALAVSLAARQLR